MSFAAIVVLFSSRCCRRAVVVALLSSLCCRHAVVVVLLSSCCCRLAVVVVQLWSSSCGHPVVVTRICSCGFARADLLVRICTARSSSIEPASGYLYQEESNQHRRKKKNVFRMWGGKGPSGAFLLHALKVMGPPFWEDGVVCFHTACK